MKVILSISSFLQMPAATLTSPYGPGPGISTMFTADMEMASKPEERRHFGVVFHRSRGLMVCPG